MGDCLLCAAIVTSRRRGFVKSRDLLGKYLLCPSKKNELPRARPHKVLLLVTELIVFPQPFVFARRSATKLSVLVSN